jgi:hypothetical protein
LLITLCISCHVGLHRYRGLSRWIPKVLLELWSEIHSGQPFQLQLPLAMSTRAADAKFKTCENGRSVLARTLFAMALKCRAVSTSWTVEFS